jgi:hypothetical protein
MSSTAQTENVSWIPPESNSILNSITGILSKAADTALDVYGMKEQGKIIGSVYPSGQVNPQMAPAQTAAVKPAVNYTPYIIGGGALLLVIVLVVATRK